MVNLSRIVSIQFSILLYMHILLKTSPICLYFTSARPVAEILTEQQAWRTFMWNVCVPHREWRISATGQNFCATVYWIDNLFLIFSVKMLIDTLSTNCCASSKISAPALLFSAIKIHTKNQSYHLINTFSLKSKITKQKRPKQQSRMY